MISRLRGERSNYWATTAVAALMSPGRRNVTCTCIIYIAFKEVVPHKYFNEPRPIKQILNTYLQNNVAVVLNIGTWVAHVIRAPCYLLPASNHFIHVQKYFSYLSKVVSFTLVNQAPSPIKLTIITQA